MKIYAGRSQRVIREESPQRAHPILSFGPLALARRGPAKLVDEVSWVKVRLGVWGTCSAPTDSLELYSQ